MFRYYNSVTFQNTPSGGTVFPPISDAPYNTAAKLPLNSVQLTLPPHEGAGAKLGCWLVAQYLEYLKFRKPQTSSSDVNKCRIDSVSSLYAKAIALDKTLSIVTDDLHPSLYSCLTGLASVMPAPYNTYQPIFFNTLNLLKMHILKYGCAILETYYLSSMRPSAMSNTQFIIGDSSTAVYSQFTKGFLAVGFDEATKHILVQDSFGPKLGQLGFLKISYDILNKSITLPNGETKTVFIKGAVLKNCLSYL